MVRVGARPGSDASLRSEYVVLSAHLDHVGVGEPIKGDRIYNGAMDDASGVASLLDIAAALDENKTQTKRSLLFVVVTGEEKGLLGSRYFVAHPTVPLSSLAADLNMDMFLPLYPLQLLTVWGLGESDLGDMARRVSKSLDVEVQDDPQPQRNVFIRSDQYSFIRKRAVVDDGVRGQARFEGRADRQDVVDQPLSCAVGRSEPAGGPESRRPVQPAYDDAHRSGGK
jgi:Zn-dependent M28 family amino/carboxypeptidase